MAAGHLCSQSSSCSDGLAVLPGLEKPVLQGTVARPWATGHLLRQLLCAFVEMLGKLLSSTQQAPASPSVGETGSEREKQTEKGRGMDKPWLQGAFHHPDTLPVGMMPTTSCSELQSEYPAGENQYFHALSMYLRIGLVSV